jgi:PiT family inorganic phosphate transporter
MSVLSLLSGVFLGWGLGANDSANIFGTAVHSRVVSFRLAITLTAIFVILGATLEGHQGVVKVSSLSATNGILTLSNATFVMFAAGLTVLLMTLFELPVSTSQAVIGAILGHGFLVGQGNLGTAKHFFGAWIFTPIGGMLFAMILYGIIKNHFEKRLTNFRFFQIFIRYGYIFAGIFGAYSLGANNAANVFGVISSVSGGWITSYAGLLGGLAIALGVLTYSKPVMKTVGKGILPLSDITGFIVVIASAITVYIYARVGIPVSTSQAVVGSLVGIGLIKDYRIINIKLLYRILIGWFMTPAISGLLSYLLLTIFI